MAIIDTLTKFGFVDAFRRIRPDNFSYGGLETLYDYLEQLSEDTGENIKFDPIGICCDYSEYENFKDLQKDYPDVKDMDELESNTTVIMIDDESFIIWQY